MLADLSFNYAAVILSAALLFFFRSKKFFNSQENHTFWRVSVGVFVNAVLGVSAVCVYTFFDRVPLWTCYLINILYYTAMLFCICGYFVFITQITGIYRKKYCLILFWILHVLATMVLVFVCITPITKLVFFFDEKGYHHGPAFLVYVIALVVGLGLCCFCSVFYRKSMSILSQSLFYAAIPLVLGAAIIELTNDNIRLINFSAVLANYILYESLQNPSTYLDERLHLFNMTAFQNMIDAKIEKKNEFTVLAFELEGFNFVDQFLGVENGDKLLEDVCEECCDNLKGSIYHLEGTQFAIISDKNSNDVKDNAEWISWRFLSTFSIKRIDVTLSARMCGVNYPEIASNKDEILNAIIYSLAQASKDNTNEIVWATKERIQAYQRSAMITHILKRAIINRQFEVYYQPIYSTKRKGFKSAEALVRLNDDQLGFISPEEFVPIAEKNGLILEIGDFVFEQVCDFISSGEAATLDISYIEVNLSMVQCMQESLHSHLLEIMDRFRIPYNMIDFEITETFNISDNEILTKNMKSLMDAGCTFALDDYGTGFSNTSYLMEYPFKLVKLDKSFVWGAMESENARIILKNTVRMLKELDLKIVAEGVETKQQAQILIEMGCDYLQGYYFSTPIPKDKYVEYLKYQGVKICKQLEKE